jgi:hypothetical protein
VQSILYRFKLVETRHGSGEEELETFGLRVLAGRLREIREDMYAEHGGQFLADALQIPLLTWLNYESGVVAPAYVVL